MIEIIERLPKKIPGESSLFVSFDYKPEVVATIKTCTPNHFDAKTKMWEIPTTRLAKFVNGVHNYDEVDIKLLKVKPKENIEYKLSKFKTKPYKYQEEGIQYGLNNDSFLLLDAPGLGKTLQMIYLAEELKKTRGIKHCLIVCGINTLKTNWEKEIHKHSKEKCVILGKKITKTGKVWYDGNKARIDQLQHKINEFFIICNIESLREDKFLAALKKGPNKIDMVIVDEIHTCFPYDTLVDTSEGILKIGDVVEKEIPCLIKTKNLSTGDDEYQPVTQYHKNPTILPLLKIKVQTDDGKTHTISCTEDHKIFTHNRGFISAKDLTENDLLEVIAQ